MEAAVAYANNLMATELRLGLPGSADDDQQTQTTNKAATPRGKKRTTTFDAKETNNSKAQVVGWPPVRSYRKSCFQQQTSNNKQQATNKEEAAAAPKPKLSSTTTPTTAAANNTTTSGGSFVKVSMDGAPYLRKVDLRMYKGYRELREALEAMFVSSNNGGNNLSEFAVTYEDKDGDLMLVGDVPFEMFTGTCKKLRVIKRSEATGLGSPSEAK
jgi:auxin-responsive protein IAA